MSVGVYASISLKSMDTLRFGTANASWVSTIMVSNMIDLYDLLTDDELETVTDIFKEAMGRNNILPEIWEPILKVETS